MCSEEDDSESDKQKEILFSAFDDWLSKNVVYNFRADLFFIPLRVDDHYLCVCINFISKKIEVLDNQFHGKADHSSLRQLVVAVVCFECLIKSFVAQLVVLYLCYTCITQV